MHDIRITQPMLALFLDISSASIQAQRRCQIQSPFGLGYFTVVLFACRDLNLTRKGRDPLEHQVGSNQVSFFFFAFLYSPFPQLPCHFEDVLTEIVDILASKPESCREASRLRIKSCSLLALRIRHVGDNWEKLIRSISLPCEIPIYPAQKDAPDNKMSLPESFDERDTVDG